MSERSHGCLLVLLLLLVRLGGAEFRFPSGEGEEEVVTVSQEAARRSYGDQELPGEVQTKTKITVSNTKHLRGNRFQMICKSIPVVASCLLFCARSERSNSCIFSGKFSRSRPNTKGTDWWLNGVFCVHQATTVNSPLSTL